MAAAAINLHELEQELTRTKSMFEQWSAAMLSRAQGCKSSHTSKLLAHKGEITALTERYQRAEKQAAQVRQQMTQDREHEQALQVTADSLMTEQHALQKRLQQLTLEYQSEADTVQQLQTDVDATRADLDLRLAKLDELHNAYQNALGLKLQSEDGQLFLEFTQISAEQPEKPYGFAVQVLEDEEYRVTRCEPDVPQRAVLEQQLLEGRIEFAGFVRAMRQAFKVLAAAEAEEEQHA